MAADAHLVWILLFLTSVLPASDSRHVQRRTENSESSSVDNFFSKISPLDVQSCDAAKEQMLLLDGQLQQTSLHNSQLSEEAFGLRREVTMLKHQLGTCSLTASAGSYKSHLHVRMKQLLDGSDNDSFLILKILALTGEVSTLEKKVKLAANSTESTTERGELQRELQEKISELHNKTQQIVGRGDADSSLILQIVSLQNQIWDFHQSESRRSGSSLQPDRRLLDLQEELESKLSELQSKGHEVKSVLMLQLISVYSKRAAKQRKISGHFKEASSRAADLQRQRKQKADLLKKKILQLNRDENNSELTKDILTLQSQIVNLAQLIAETTKTSDSQLEELKRLVEEEKKQQEALEKRLEGIDYAQTQQILKIIGIMEEIREETTPSAGATNPWALLKDKDREFVKAQIEINGLQQKLQQLTKSWLTPEDRYKQAKLVVELKMAELSRSADSAEALVLKVIYLLGEIEAVREQISTSEDQHDISELQLNLERKQEELNSRTAELERQSATPGPILRAAELINEMWELQKQPVNESRNEREQALHDRLEGLMGELEEENIKLMLQTLLEQSEVELLQRRLSDPQPTSRPPQEAKLRAALEARRDDLEKHISRMNEKNHTKLIWDVTVLQRKLRELDREKQTENPTTALTVTRLKKQLESEAEKNAQLQAAFRALQDKLNQTDAHCFDFEQKVKDLQTDLDGKLKELQSKSPSQTSLALQVSQLTLQLEQLKRQLENPPGRWKVAELQRQIDEKNHELDKKTAELRETSRQPQILLQMIAKQVEIDKTVSLPSDDRDYQIIAAIQDQLKHLINGIQDENTKLTFQIMAQQGEIKTLKRQEEHQKKTLAKEIEDLENELEDTRTQIEEKSALLDSRDMLIANLSDEILGLHRKIQPLEQQILNLQARHAGIFAGLEERLNSTRRALHHTERQLKHADAKNFDLIKEIVDLRTDLKNLQEETPRDATQKIDDLDKQLQHQQLEKRKLDRTNKELKKQVTELKVCCTDVNSQCEDSRRRLQQSQEDVDRLQQQLHGRDAALQLLQQELQEQTRTSNKLQEEIKNLQNKLEDVDDSTINTPKITLDPNTAHPRIALSAENTEMSTTEHFQGIPDHPGRYNVVLAVLGATGFSAGRQYWEVSVRGKNCYHLGMASESAPRKGSLAFKPANGFWTVILDRQGQFKALDEIAATLPLQTLPVTLGVLLDYKRGQISFYDAGARSRIYSFSGQRFTDKIHPFVNFCVENSSPIVLISPESTDWIK